MNTKVTTRQFQSSVGFLVLSWTLALLPRKLQSRLAVVGEKLRLETWL